MEPNVSYVIRVNGSRFGSRMWVLEDSVEPGRFGTLSLTETASKRGAKRYPTRADATGMALQCAALDPEYIGKLSVQWVPACGS